MIVLNLVDGLIALGDLVRDRPEVSSHVDRSSLALQHLLHNLLFGLSQLLGQRLPGGIFFGKFFSPVQSEVEIAAPVVDLPPLPPRSSVLLQPLSNRIHKGVAETSGRSIRGSRSK